MEWEQCQERVWDGKWHYYQCSKKSVVSRDGKSYCKIHDPEYIKAMQAKRTAQWNAAQAQKETEWALARARYTSTEGLTIEELEQVTPDLIRERILRPGLLGKRE